MPESESIWTLKGREGQGRWREGGTGGDSLFIFCDADRVQGSSSEIIRLLIGQCADADQILWTLRIVVDVSLKEFAILRSSLNLISYLVLIFFVIFPRF